MGRVGEERFSFLLVHLHQRPAVGGPTRHLLLVSYLILCLQGGASQNVAEGRLSMSFHITWPNPSFLRLSPSEVALTGPRSHS